MQYYVIKNKNTGLYFRGKGVNRWGEFNQASIYRFKKKAEHTLEELSLRGEQGVIVHKKIITNTECELAEIADALNLEKEKVGEDK